MSPLDFQPEGGRSVALTDDAPVFDAPAVTADVVASFGGTVKDRMRAKRVALERRTRQFPMPPTDVWGDDLVLVAKPVDLVDGMTNVEVIAESTHDVLLRDDTGAMRSVPEGWAGVGRLMGVVSDDPDGPPVSVGQIILAVCSSKAIVGALADDLVGFTLGRRSRIAEALGE